MIGASCPLLASCTTNRSLQVAAQKWCKNRSPPTKFYGILTFVTPMQSPIVGQYRWALSPQNRGEIGENPQE